MKAAAGNLFRLLRAIMFSNFSDRSMPYKLTFSVTDLCNQRCVNCGIWQKSKNIRELTVSDIDRFFKDYNGYSWIDVTGGEIFMRQDIDELFSCIIHNCRSLYMLHFPTNGMLPEKIAGTAENILKSFSGKLVVTVSLDGPRAMHDRLRGSEGSWEKSVATYKLLEQIPGVEVYIGMTLSEHNWDVMDETLLALQKRIEGITLKDIHVNFFNRSEHFFNNLDSALNAQQDILSSIKSFSRRKGLPRNRVEFVEKLYLGQIEKFFSSGITPLPCASLSSSIFLDAAGDIYPCTIFSEHLANIKDQGYSLRSLLKSDKYMSVRKTIKLKNCPNCWTPCEAYQSIFASILKPWRFCGKK